MGFGSLLNGHIPDMPVLRRQDHEAQDRRTRRVPPSKRRAARRTASR